MSKSAFETWFVEQFGRPPRGWQRASDRLNVARAVYTRAEAFYDRVRNYEDSRTAALYAWRAARDK